MTESQTPETGKATKARKQPKKQLTQVQLRTLAYIQRVGAATRDGIYHAGVSDSTGRTLASLERDGYVSSTIAAAGQNDLELYYVSLSGEQELEQVRALVRSL